MTMKAIVIDRYGTSDRLQLREVERPRPSAGEVLIRVHAAGVNPIDWKVRRGLLRPVLWLRFPIILGSDVAGVVEEVGPGVTRFRPGDPVFALLYPKRHGPGGYAEYAVAPDSAVARKPEALSFEEAASMPVAALTALQSLRDLGRLAAGGSALIDGASGGVGTFAVQLARALGAARVAGVCGPSNVELVRGLGADTVIDYTREDFTRRPDRLDVILDAVAKSSFGACRRILGPRGTYVTTLPMPGVLFWGALLPVAGRLGYGKRAKFVVAQARGSDLEFLGRLVDEGKLRPIIDRIFAFDQVKEAHDFSETGRARGKIVLSAA
jgi:NADPH:quinone reductase-like Zn-dependent oxidoreductase